MRVAFYGKFILLAQDDKTEPQFALQVALAEAISKIADDYWRDWLWSRRPTRRSPDLDICDRLAAEYGVSCQSVQVMWREWHTLLTSWDYVEALTGVDFRSLASAECGRSHRRA